MNVRWLLCVTLVITWACAAIPSPARGDDPEAEKARDEVYRMLPVDSMIRQAAENVSRRYNLNEEQTRFTHDMMVKRVTKFLEEHEDELWPLVRELVRHQQQGKALDADTARRLGKIAQPIFEEAREAILEANEEWRDILNDQQKLLHDYDLQEMGRTFGDMEQRFDQWEQGRAEANQGIFPEPRVDQPPIVNPPAPEEGKSTTARVIRQKEEWWDGYVEGFIKDYELDEGQITTARSILKEMKERAAAYRRAHKAEFDETEKKAADALKAADRQKHRAAIEEERKLSQPIGEMFGELKERLDKIPRPAQREAYEAQRQAARPRKTPPTTTRAAAEQTPTTQPADSSKTKGATKTKDTARTKAAAKKPPTKARRSRAPKNQSDKK
jgi:hypothetical protein